MINMGEYNTLEVVRVSDFGCFLSAKTGRTSDDILLPKSNTEGKDLNIGDEVEVFVYRDSKDRPVATMKRPMATVGQLAYLAVRSVTKIGVFLDFGLERDILVPFKEQKYYMRSGSKYLVYIYLDKSGRIAATTDVDRFLDITEEYKSGDDVKGIVYDFQTNGSAEVAVEGKYKGVILKNEIFREIHEGDELELRVKKHYEDGRLGLTPRQGKLYERDDLSEKILSYLNANNGTMPFNDKSNPEDIKKVFETSKNYFKIALGGLMKRGLIEQDENGTKLKK
jgi:uncharacterized protein